MAKNTTDKTQQTAEQPVNEEQKEVVTPQILTAETREDIFQQVEELKATLPEGKTLTAGAVGKQEDGTFAIRIDII